MAREYRIVPEINRPAPTSVVRTPDYNDKLMQELERFIFVKENAAYGWAQVNKLIVSYLVAAIAVIGLPPLGKPNKKISVNVSTKPFPANDGVYHGSAPIKDMEVDGATVQKWAGELQKTISGHIDKYTEKLNVAVTNCNNMQLSGMYEEAAMFARQSKEYTQIINDLGACQKLCKDNPGLVFKDGFALTNTTNDLNKTLEQRLRFIQSPLPLQETGFMPSRVINLGAAKMIITNIPNVGTQISVTGRAAAQPAPAPAR